MRERNATTDGYSGERTQRTESAKNETAAEGETDDKNRKCARDTAERKGEARERERQMEESKRKRESQESEEAQGSAYLVNV